MPQDKVTVKETKKDKTDKKKSVKVEPEVKDSRNNATRRAGLEFNVNRARDWLKEYYAKTTNCVIVDKKSKKSKVDSEEDTKKKSKSSKEDSETEEKTSEDSTMKLRGPQYIVTCVDQILCNKILTLAFKRSKIGQGDMYRITEDNVRSVVEIDNDLKMTFGMYLEKYEESQDYGIQTKLEYDTVYNFLENHGYDGGFKNVKIEKKAYNYLMYLILNARIRLADSAYHMTLYGKKHTVNKEAMLHSIPGVFGGNLKKDIYRKAEDIIKILNDMSQKDENDDDEKKTKKNSDDESSESEEDDKKKSKSESESESESEEPEEKPKKKSVQKKNKTATDE